MTLYITVFRKGDTTEDSKISISIRNLTVVKSLKIYKIYMNTLVNIKMENSRSSVRGRWITH